MLSLISSTHSQHSNTLIGIKHNVILMTLIDFKYTLMTLKHTLVYLRHTLMTPKHTLMTPKHMLMIVMHTLIEMIHTLMVWKQYHINFDTDYTPYVYALFSDIIAIFDLLDSVQKYHQFSVRPLI